MQTLVTLLLAVLAFAQVVVLRKKWERFLRKDAVCARFTQNWPTVVKTIARGWLNSATRLAHDMYEICLGSIPTWVTWLRYAIEESETSNCPPLTTVGYRLVDSRSPDGNPV